MIEIEKTINKTLVPVNFIKGLAILYTFMVVAGMVGAIEGQALAAYLFMNKNKWGYAATSGSGIAFATMGLANALGITGASTWGFEAMLAAYVAGTVASDGLTGLAWAFAAALPIGGWFFLGVGLA